MSIPPMASATFCVMPSVVRSLHELAVVIVKEWMDRSRNCICLPNRYKCRGAATLCQLPPGQQATERSGGIVRCLFTATGKSGIVGGLVVVGVCFPRVSSGTRSTMDRFSMVPPLASSRRILRPFRLPKTKPSQPEA